MKSKIIPAAIAVLIIALVAVAYLSTGHFKGTQLSSTVSPTSTISATSTINATPVITYESTSAGETGEWFNLSLPVPSGYTFTNKTLRNYTFCPYTYKYFSTYYTSEGDNSGAEYAYTNSSTEAPFCTLEWVSIGPKGRVGQARNYSTGVLFLGAMGMIEVYNATGVKITDGWDNKHINYTINDTYSSWLIAVSLVCDNGLPCSISTPNGCKIVQHATVQPTSIHNPFGWSNVTNSSVTMEVCRNQNPGKYNLTINFSNETEATWYINYYYSGPTRNATQHSQLSQPNKSSNNATSFSAPAHQIFVTNWYSDSVSVINASNYAVVKTIAGLQGPQGIAVSPNGSQIFITNSGGNTVSVVNTLTDSIVSNITVGQNPVSVAFSPNGKRAYVVNGNNSWQGNVSIINATTDVVIDTIPVGDGAAGIAVSPVYGDEMLVAEIGSGKTLAIDPIGDFVISNLNITTYYYSWPLQHFVGDRPNDVVFSPNGTKAFISSFDGAQVYVINTTTNKIIKNITTGITSDIDGSRIAVSPNGAQVIVTGANQVTSPPNLNGAIFVINTTTDNITKTISNMYNPYAIAFSPDGSKIFVSNFDPGPGDHYINVFNATTYAVINTIKVGLDPSGIVVT